ncbi:hypothetical protein EYZ11_010156 [Aspergillus tanneri]|uniref:DUF7703 domain-containing protein n=1 Tax=Aspergillus tanneri TaxID=1220188 RepID=A0A4S3J6C4_9EURO|nr:uncharacterized protein ATNIH1004_001653 [Aspergillus tanneri]KAA8652748.1 hypothetical protein ATNIH1004_001653 [Aspergillus tanneri]THC90375.1 hypothetical protein EYZ11_010156 [Aspergillus tanneri]
MSPAESPADAVILLSSTLDQVQKYVISAFAAIVWYNAIELVILCLTTFKRYRSTYFWSLLIASSSLIPHGLGFIFFLFSLGISPYIAVTLIIVSWYCMVTGHSFVLWSRLHLILQSPKLLRAILIMIIVNAILFHIPTTVLLFGSLSSRPSHPNHFAAGYNVMERIQLVGFAVQEFIISAVYVWETTKMLRLRPDRFHRGILLQLLIINIIILVLDVAVVGTEYAGYYALQVMFKPVAYSVKFKLEYSILGSLVQIARSPTSNPEQLSSSFLGYNFISSGRNGSGRNSAAGADAQQMTMQA